MEAHIRKTTGAVAYVGAQYTVGFAEMDHIFEEFEHIPILLKQAPIQPGSNIILAVCIVIAELGVAEFISGEEHRDTPAAHKECECIAHHPPSESQDIRIVGIAFNSAVPAIVVVGAVSIIPAVFLIVFRVV